MSDHINELQFFRELYIRHYGTVYRLASHMLRASGNSAEDAADLAHDTFLLAAQNIQKLKTHSNPGGWLYAVARNLCRNYIRTCHTVPMGNLDELYPCPSNDFDLADAKILLGQELAPEDIRLIFAQHEGRTSEEIGRQFGITASAVRKRMSRIRAKLRPFFIFLVTFLLVHYI